MVGAMSARIPSRSFTLAPMIAKGTLFVVCAVKGFPSGSNIFSQFPWSAVIKLTPPMEEVASTTWLTQLSMVSTALQAAS